jgi:cytochrome c6
MASPRPDPLARVDRVLAPLSALAAVFAVVVLLLGPELIGAKQPSANAHARSGKQIFAAEGCGGCHTLAAAGASGTAGPDLDQLRPDAATVAAKVSGGGGAMPSFDLPAPELRAVAQYVSSVAGR